MKVKKILASFYIFWLPIASSHRLWRIFLEIWRIKTLKLRQFEKLSPQKKNPHWRADDNRQAQRERERACVCEERKQRQTKEEEKKRFNGRAIKTLRVVFSLSFPRAVSRVVAIQTAASYLTPFIKSMTKATRCIKGK